MILDLKQGFMLKRLRAQEECELFISKLREDEYFNNLYLDLNEKQIEYVKARFEKESQLLKTQVEELKAKIEKYLDENNIDKTKLTPKYDCEKCNDTGVYQGKICSCLLNTLNMKISKMTSSQTDFKGFSECNKNIMDENDLKTANWLKSWCNKYPNVTKININLIGGAGTGKTFLLECVANEMLKKNQVVCYKTAFELNEIARLYHMGKSFDFGDCINADILLIDDLGTEPILKNITKEYLYNLINVRQINNRPTFISTNLSLDNILDRYDDRIFSRLGNKNLSINIQLTSNDKRI